MPAYRYSASDINGRMMKGKMDAADEKQLKDNLMQHRLYLVSCETYVKKPVTKPIPLTDVSDICRQTGVMLRSGITVIAAINVMLEREMSPNVKTVLDYMYKQIKLGNSLSETMRSSGAFPPLLISMTEAGEEGGNTDKIMLRMADYYENEYKTRSSVKAALAYPIFLAVLLLGAMIGIFTFIIPRFMTVFEGMSELPAVTRAVLAISGFFVKYWLYVILAVIMLGLFIKILAGMPGVRVFFSKGLLHTKKLGRLLSTVYTARFCRTFSELYSSGMPILKALQAAKTTIGAAYIENQFDGVIRDVRQGITIAEAISKVDGFDPKLKSAILIGEESGKLEYMLMSMAESFEFESDRSVKKLTSMIEPVMIAVMGLLVALVFISVMLPVFTLYDSI